MAKDKAPVKKKSYKTYAIDQHPKKDMIIKKLCAGVPFGDIVKQYGTSKASLSRYMNDKLIPRAAAEQAKRNIKDGQFVLDRIDGVIEKMEKALNACDDYLTDPADPTKYSLLPRAWEQDIKYREVTEEGVSSQKTMTVQALIDEMRGNGKIMDEIKYKHQDPRKMLTDLANSMAKNLELLARIQGTIKDVTINIVQTPVWNEVRVLMLQVTEDYPEIREQIAQRFAEIAKGE